MEHYCYRCGGQVENQAPFCPACGAPQIRVPSREPQAEVTHEPVPPPPPPAGQITTPSAYIYPGQIHWKIFFRIALPVAAVAGLTTAFLGLLGWLLLFGVVFFAIHRYRRVRPGPLAASQGAKMGVLTAVLSFAFFAVLFGGRVAANPADLRTALDKASQQMAALNLDPESTRMAQAMFAGTRGLVLFTGMVILFTLVFLVIFGSIAGALAAGFSREKPSA